MQFDKPPGALVVLKLKCCLALTNPHKSLIAVFSLPSCRGGSHSLPCPLDGLLTAQYCEWSTEIPNQMSDVQKSKAHP